MENDTTVRAFRPSFLNPEGTVRDKPREFDFHALQPNPNLQANLDYPRMLHRWGDGPGGKPEHQRLTVRDQIAELEATEKGYSRTLPEPPEAQVPAAQPERRGPGRPRKEE